MGTTGLGSDHSGEIEHDRQQQDSEDEAVAGHGLSFSVSVHNRIIVAG